MINKKNTTIVLADDHPLLLKGLSEEFIDNGYNVVGQATNGMQALELILVHNPVLAFLDIDMPLLTGFEVIKMAKEKKVQTKFIVLSFHKEKNYIIQAQNLQINGYLLKEDSFAEIELCMQKVLAGEICFSPSFGKGILQNASEELKRLGYLTPSEKTILKLIAQQKTSLEIAEMLFISERTVEKHRSNIIAKLDLDSSTNSLTSWAILQRDTIKNL